jgi:ribosomal protein S18 acetylase RimI-like enzyme
MVLFEFDKIIKSKYKIKNKNLNNSINLSFEEHNKKCYEKIFEIFPLYFTGISEKYIEYLFLNNKSKILFITTGDKFILNSIISIIIYYKTSSKNKIKYYVLCFGTHKKFRKFGYGKYSLDEFVNWIKYKNKSNKVKIILLKSVESSLNFYLTYGFIITNLYSNKLFYKYEPLNELKNNLEKILEFTIE